MICQGYAKYELPPNTPIQVSIGVDITDIPKVNPITSITIHFTLPSILSSHQAFKVDHELKMKGFRHGLYDHPARLLYGQVEGCKADR